jgi:hypothetical protein
MARQTLEEAVAELRASLEAIFVPPLERLLRWIDRRLGGES